MKTFLVSIFLTLTSLIVAEERSVTAVTANPWQYGVSELAMSKYYGSIFGGTFYPGPMSFTDLSASRQNRFGSLTLDLSLGQKLDRLDAYNRDGGNEYDFTVDQTFRFGSKSHPVLIDAGLCYLTVHDLRKMSDDAFEEFVRLDFPIGADRTDGPIFEPYVEIFHYQKVGGFLDNGWFMYGGAFRDQKLGCRLLGKELVLNIDYRMGVSAGGFSSKSGIEYHRLTLSLPIQGKKWTVVPSLIAQVRGGEHQTFVHKNEVFETIQFKRAF